MVSGPVRNKRYSRPIETLPVSVFAHSLSVRTFFTLNAMRNWRWSWRFSPTPGDSCANGDAVLAKQRRRTHAGELEDLRQIRSSRRRAPFRCALRAYSSSPPRENSTPAARFPSSRSRRACEFVRTVRLGAASRVAGTPSRRSSARRASG